LILLALTSNQIENIQIDYGIIYKNYGETTQELLGPTRGGGEFVVSKNIRDIEFDGMKGKSKYTQVVDEINAQLNVTILNTSMQTLALAMPYTTLNGAGTEGDPYNITCKISDVCVVSSSNYLTNITMFAKLISGGYKKITLYNAMNESDFGLTAAPKGEGEISLEIYAHWDPTDDSSNLYKIEDVSSIAGDTSAPTVVTVPADSDTDVVITNNLTATFSEQINPNDVKNGNFILISAGGDLIDGTLTYNSTTKVVTFNPTASLTASTVYIWTISNVRDIAGNEITRIAVNFTTAA